MRWSKLKQRIEECFADTAKGRVEVWSTRYRGSRDQHGEAWITIDKVRIHSMGSLTQLVELFERSTRLQQERDCLDYNDSEKIEAYRSAQDEVLQSQRNEGIIPVWEFNNALFDYLNMPFDQILRSDHSIVRALGMFDKRLGKRRLKEMDVSAEHEIVQKFFRIRCAFEGIHFAAPEK